MEHVTDILKLLFGQLGVVGAVCFIASVHIAYLLDVERKDHKETRALLQKITDTQAGINLRITELLGEIKGYLRMRGTPDDPHHGSR